MKKFFFLFAVILLVGGSTVAQKKNVAKAKAKLLSEPTDFNAAKEAILPALKDSVTSKLASTWFVAGEVFNGIYTEQRQLQWTQKSGNQVLMAQSLKNALDYYTIADSLDLLPNAKGVVKPKFHSKIIEKVKEFQRGFTESGSYFYEQKDYKNALLMFDTYLKYPSIPYLKDMGLEKDTLIPLITYYCGLSASQAGEIAVADKYYEQIKDKIDSKWIYARLCDDYIQLNDTANMLRMYQLGAKKFPDEPFYVRSLINYYINKNLMDEAFQWINQAIEQDPNNGSLWNVKGRIQENNKMLDDAKNSYQKAVELNPNLADALGNIGRLYYNKAVEELERVNAIRDDKKYKAEKIKLKVVFEQPRPYFEKALSINPNDIDYVIALRGIYYNLGMEKKYQEMDALIKELKNK